MTYMNKNKQADKKTLYILFAGRFPGEKAAALFVAKEAEAFAGAGEKVVILASRRFERSGKTAGEYYNIQQNFSVKYLPVIDLFHVPIFKSLAHRIVFVTFSISVFVYLSIKLKKNDVVYSNDTIPMFFASLLTKKTLLAIHDFPQGKSWLYRPLYRRMGALLLVTQSKLAKLSSMGVVHKNAFHEPNAVDLTEFNGVSEKEPARAKLSLPLDKKIVLYTGHLFGWKGVDTLAEAIEKLPEDTLVYFVGGTEKDIQSFTKKYGGIRNIRIIGFRPHAEIPLWQTAADVLVLPNSAHDPVSVSDTSPMKLFEYMASKRPIVASRLPSVTEILSDKNAFLFTADDVSDCAYAITDAFTNKNKQKQAIAAAYEWVLDHTWKKRAQRIIGFIKRL